MNTENKKNWFADNWDKVFGILLAGIIGYFSGQIALQNKIGTIEQRIAVLEGPGQILSETLASRFTAVSVETDGVAEDIRRLKDDDLLKLQRELEDIENRINNASPTLDVIESLDNATVLAVKELSSSKDKNMPSQVASLRSSLNRLRSIVGDSGIEFADGFGIYFDDRENGPDRMRILVGSRYYEFTDAAINFRNRPNGSDTIKVWERGDESE